MTSLELDPKTFADLALAAVDTLIAHADELTALDKAIGDADHGINMKRGAEAVRAELPALAEKPLAEALKDVGMKLVMTVGGASGPLYGTLFIDLGKQLASGGAFAPALGAAIDAVAARGKSQKGQKTLLDVLYPVHDAIADGGPIARLPDLADRAAEATMPLKAIRGRASFLGERSIGHMDPGARSAALLVRALATRWEASR